MTLKTNIVVADPVPAERLFGWCRDLLGCDDSHRWRREDREVGAILRHERGQGVSALLWLHFATDGPLRADHDLDDAPCDRYCAVVWFDTAYGYRADNGAGCGDLHAWLISQVGAWLDDRGARWFWQDEFSGEWYPSTVSPDGILGSVSVGALT